MEDLGEESLENLEEVFQRIHTMKGEDNLDVLVARFIQGESFATLHRISHISRADLNVTNGLIVVSLCRRGQKFCTL